MNYQKRNLKISVWNINGYICKGYNKFKDPYFLEKISSNDIFCLLETHCDPDQCLSLDEYPNPVHLIRSKISPEVKDLEDYPFILKAQLDLRSNSSNMQPATIWLK